MDSRRRERPLAYRRLRRRNGGYWGRRGRCDGPDIRLRQEDRQDGVVVLTRRAAERQLLRAALEGMAKRQASLLHGLWRRQRDLRKRADGRTDLAVSHFRRRLERLG